MYAFQLHKHRRKNVAVKLIITFDKKDCFHLMGLQDYIYYTTD